MGKEMDCHGTELRRLLHYQLSFETVSDRPETLRMFLIDLLSSPEGLQEGTLMLALS